MSESPTKNIYRVVLPELTKFWRQSKGLLSARFIRPRKALYEAQVFLRDEENGRLCVDNCVLKQALREGPTLGSVSVIQPIEAHAYAFGYALGDVIVQNGQLITSKSKKPSTTEKSYTVFEE